MGWSTGWNSWEDLKCSLKDYQGKMTVLAEALVNMHHFWTVVENNETKERFIRLDLIRVCKDDWGYKDMCESMHPYTYDCPLKFLNMVPEVSGDWRAGVRKYHLAKQRSFSVGESVALRDCRIPAVRITSLKPLRGEYAGTVYRISKSLIA